MYAPVTIIYIYIYFGFGFGTGSPPRQALPGPHFPPAEAWGSSRPKLKCNREARSPCFYKARLVTNVKSLLLLSATYCEVCKLLLRLSY